MIDEIQRSAILANGCAAVLAAARARYPRRSFGGGDWTVAAKVFTKAELAAIWAPYEARASALVKGDR